ncbi:MAG: hypothetical protein Tsb009_26580 [Planctomycetaceae bacterium]
MQTFEELAKSRREWIDTVLRPWCEKASRAELVKAEIEWPNIAGQVDADFTLWTWAWSRFPALMHDEMPGVNETYRVEVILRDGRTVSGYPDARATDSGKLLLLMPSGELSEPMSLDDILNVVRVE